MLILVAAFVLIAGARAWQRRRRAPPAFAALRTCIDVCTPAEAVALVRALSRPRESTDDIMTRLVRLYGRFAPHERCLQCMSVAQQWLEGTGGEQELCVALLYSSMMLALSEDRKNEDEEKKKEQ
jgi:hypothetical protein